MLAALRLICPYLLTHFNRNPTARIFTLWFSRQTLQNSFMAPILEARFLRHMLMVGRAGLTDSESYIMPFVLAVEGTQTFQPSMSPQSIAETEVVVTAT